MITINNQGSSITAAPSDCLSRAVYKLANWLTYLLIYMYTCNPAWWSRYLPQTFHEHSPVHFLCENLPENFPPNKPTDISPHTLSPRRILPGHLHNMGMSLFYGETTEKLRTPPIMFVRGCNLCYNPTCNVNQCCTDQLKVFGRLFSDFLSETCVKVCQIVQFHLKPIPTDIIMPPQLITDISTVTNIQHLRQHLHQQYVAWHNLSAAIQHHHLVFAGSNNLSVMSLGTPQAFNILFSAFILILECATPSNGYLSCLYIRVVNG